MAKNETRDYMGVWHRSVICTSPATPVSGDPIRCGYETGIALTDESVSGTDLSGNPTGYTTVNFGPFGANFSVKGVNDGGNTAIADGDEIFYVDADTPHLSAKTSGYFFGFARGAVLSGATSTIEVDHIPSPGSGNLGSGTVGTSNLATGAVTTIKLADDNVTAAKLTDTLALGMIPLPLGSAREIVANAIPNAAAIGGLLASDTTPILERVNGATDKKMRLRWAATNVDALQWDITYPPDLDDTANVIVYVLAAMGGASDTPTLAINYFEGLGDTNAGGNTAAVTGTSIAVYSRTITAANIGAYPNGASIEIVPAAHGTDTLLIYAAWVEYTRK